MELYPMLWLAGNVHSEVIARTFRFANHDGNLRIRKLKASLFNTVYGNPEAKLEDYSELNEASRS
jgi:hypothetical protein